MGAGRDEREVNTMKKTLNTMTEKELSLFARRIAGEIVEIAPTFRQASIVVEEIERQFKYAKVELRGYAVGLNGVAFDMPRPEPEEER